MVSAYKFLNHGSSAQDFKDVATDRRNHSDKCQRELETEIANKPNQNWVGDITYFPTDKGWLYAAIVKDLCIKKIVGYAFSSRIDTNLTVSALEMAVNRQKPQNNLIFHSDRGVQYASLGYREALAKHSITQSMSRNGNPYDNAVAEKFF